MNSPSITVNKAMVMDKTEHYYAFGNTPPDLLLPPGVVNPKILCLAAGDLRSCLFSISRTDMTQHSNVLFAINDRNSAIIARNILLLALLIHPDLACECEDIWPIWYSISLSLSQWNLVKKVLLCLLNDPRTPLSKLNTTIEPSTLLACEEVWKMWLEMEIPAKKADEMQKSYLKRYSKASDGQEMYNYFVSQGYIASTFVNNSNGKRIRLPTLHLEEENLSELCISFSNPRFAIGASDLVVNKTMFMSPNRYNLHYCSAFYRSFHLWSFRPSRESLNQFCQSQFAQWVRDFRLVSKKVEFTFAQGDCCSICMENNHWHRYFNVIDTSNVCDHIGLLGIMLICWSLIVPDGHMFTKNMTKTFGNTESDYLKKELILESEKWSGLYGWFCHGFTETHGEKEVINIEWPLKSMMAPFKFQWRPALTRSKNESDTLIVLKNILDQNYSSGYFSTALAVLFLVEQCGSYSLDFLMKFKTAIPKERFLEMRLWLPKVANVPKETSVWINVKLKDETLFRVNQFNSTPQPWLKIEGTTQDGEVHCFTIITLERSPNGKTLSCTFLVPSSIQFSSLKLLNCNNFSYDIWAYNANDGTTPNLFCCEDSSFTAYLLRRIEIKSNVISTNVHKCNHVKQEPIQKCRFSVRGIQDWKKSRNEPFNVEEQSTVDILSIVSTQIMSKYELLTSRSNTFGTISNDEPSLMIKELILQFVLEMKSRNTICIEDGRGCVPMVIVKEGIYQSEISGVPLFDLIVFLPEKPFSMSHVPRQLKNHHQENPMISRTVLPWRARKYLVDMIECLAGRFKWVDNAWGHRGEIHRLFLPTLFLKRYDALEEALHVQYIYDQIRSSLNNPNLDEITNMEALKKHGNELMAKQKFEEAVFSYTLAALKLENINFDDSNYKAKRLAAQCHNNLALAKYNLGTDEAITDAIRSTSFAIKLFPTWGKPFFRRGVCYEKQDRIKLAIKDLQKARKLLPHDHDVKRCLDRLQRKWKYDET